MSKQNNSTDASKEVRTSWATAKPERGDYATVFNELNAMKLVGEASVFERGPHVPITHMGYFKPPMDAFLTELKSKDRRSAKEWEYVNAAGVWLEAGLASLSLAKENEGELQELGRRLVLSEMALKAALEVLSMRAQYFRDVTEHGVDEARQTAFLVEQGNDAVHSESYRSAREVLTARLETETAKQLAKSRLERGRGRSKKSKRIGGGANAADSE